MGGQALTAGELAREAGVTAQTASGHLARLSKEIRASATLFVPSCGRK
jgi:predicted ArsR family transcriptional regulator